ncbi:auxilin-like protein 1 isoform X2 [Abrus precatorius]|uniref:Auxilin-like protein 1 isoform X2 n=1 Tax=Abrus precatorius TaxID=3816 RepID=A0A8B8JEG3_ABRPR|nr:auxilin-like protein 1 isoform X2 [Abrus precatorius]
MEFGTATATLTKKLSSGYGVSGRSAYDGVFATPIKLRATSFTSQFDDYREIFAGSGASLGSSIPILELPELHERKTMDDVRRSRLDYSKVFGGFENLDAAVPFEELVAEPNENNSFTNATSTRNKIKGGNQSCREDRTKHSKEIPVVSQPSTDAKRVNMSYHKVNQGSEIGTNGTTHIAQLHAVPAYTQLIEEVNPVKLNRANEPISLAQDTLSGSHCNEEIKESVHSTKSFTGVSSDNTNKQSSNNGVKVKNRSDPIDLFFDACEISDGINGIHCAKVPLSENTAGNLNNHIGDTMKPSPIKCQASKSGTSERAAGGDSPSYFDDMVDANSEAAASLAALRKAIEEAQVRMLVAKESMRRKKEGFADRVKHKSNIELKAEGKKENKVPYKTMKPEEINTRQTFRNMDALPKASSEVGKSMMRLQQARSDRGAKEAVQEAQKKLKSTQAKHKEEIEQTEADHKGKVLELKEAENHKKELYIKSTDSNASDKPEEPDHTIEMVQEYWEKENNEEKLHADNEASACEEPVQEPKHRCQEVVDKTQLIRETLDNGTMDKILKVNKDGDFENKVTAFYEPEDYEGNLGGQGLLTGNGKKVACKSEDGKIVEGSFELEELKISAGAVLELGEVEKNIAQEQKGSEDKIASNELEECELTEFQEPSNNESVCSQHGSYFISMDKEINDLGCLEDRKKRNESGFLDINQQTEHSCQREASDNTFSNICVQEILEDVVDHIHNEEEIYEKYTKDSELGGNSRALDAQGSENELEGASLLMDENMRERIDSKEPVEVIRVIRSDPICEEIKAEEAGKTTETSSSCEPDETEKLNKRVADTVIENEETLEVNPKVHSCDVQDDIMGAGNTSSQHQETSVEIDSVQYTNDIHEKRAVETYAFIQGSLKFDEAVDQMQNIFETETSEGAATNNDDIDIKVGQNKDQCKEKAENECNLAMLVEETTPESVEVCMDANEARVTLNEEVDENRCNSSNEENLFDNEHNIEASHMPSTAERKLSSIKEEEVESIHRNQKESCQASITMEEKEANDNSRKVEQEKEHLKKLDEAKEKEREREKEKLAVERAIREARERAFADARERAALERAAAEARQKNISDERERLGKIASLANEKTPAVKAAMEAKLKAERAAVERATAEARARALERALSEKAASEARNKSDKSDKSVVGLGASRDTGMKQNFHSKSFSYGVRDSTDVFDGDNCDSAQRCKARSERHQRIGERVAKALAEKNMRDRLVQKEQEERNRVAETLDADVKRWSSGKAGNLRALLSTLQYILGPDSGWQPIPLTDIVTAAAVKKAYRKATLFVHPDKLQQRGASIQQKYICEKVFDLLKEAWNRFNMEER